MLYKINEIRAYTEFNATDNRYKFLDPEWHILTKEEQEYQDSLELKRKNISKSFSVILSEIMDKNITWYILIGIVLILITYLSLYTI
jgi:hypothetical protein